MNIDLAVEKFTPRSINTMEKEVFGNLQERQKLRGCFACCARKTPPLLPLTTAIPREPEKIVLVVGDGVIRKQQQQ